MKAATVKEVIDSDQGSLKAIDPGTSYAMLVEDVEFKFNTTYIAINELFDATLPMVIDWAIGTKFDTPSCDIALRHKPTYACNSSNSHCLTVSGEGYPTVPMDMKAILTLMEAVKISTNVPTKMHAQSEESVTILEDIGALVLSVGV
ncbi:wall-associated receptor kinase 5-like protein [Carex littledalei]|uniref:Wall-associated receptor kinase 5-like protein n=1 Tax=Carex littledalei TaxID=544730 RepID=A0A833RBV4_9POAL|nr:wall-associated receptor kinase 5-like protein [Carex littledalei]